MEAKIVAQFIKENLAGKKLGLVYQNDEFGIDALGAFKDAGVSLMFRFHTPLAHRAQLLHKPGSPSSLQVAPKSLSSSV